MQTAPGGPALRFEILGPLRAWQGDHELDLGPAKQRAVLAVLLTHANRPVPTARVVEEVWGGAPPENGANVVQKYVAGLRRVLEPHRPHRTPGQLLTLTNAGYRLCVEPGCLDIDVFRGLMRDARAARAAGDPVAASRRMGEAVARWRGEALTGLPEHLLDTTRSRLGEMRVAALEEWAEVKLELGHHHGLVSELVPLVAEFPVREQLRYLLVLALYRSGRQAEALAAYRDTRAFLVGKFGVEPGVRLRQLHQRMLQADPTLDWRAWPAPTASELGAGQADPHAAHAPPTPAAARSAAADDPRISGTTPPPAGGGPRHWCDRIVAVAVPIVSFGLLTWAVTAYFAGRRRSGLLGLAAAGHFVLFAVVMFTLGNNPDSVPLQSVEIVGLTALFAAMLGGAIQGALLNPGPPSAVGRPAPPGRSRWWSWAARVVAVAVPLASLGFLAWVVVAVHAGRRRSLALGLAATGYLALAATVLVLAAMSTGVTPGGPLDDAWIVLLFLTTFGGAVHAALLHADASDLDPRAEA